MNRGVFRLVRLDEGGVQGTAENLRLVCITDRDEKVAIWGKQGGRGNIDTVLKAGIPCVVDAEWREPGDVQARKFRHRYWVREDCALCVVPPIARSHPSHQEVNTREPAVVYPEEAFEEAVFQTRQAGLTAAGCAHCFVPHFGLDAAIFIGDFPGQVRFLEAKAYGGQRPGGVGFGNRKGEGPQVDILLAAPLGSLNTSVRWAFVDATRAPGSARYALIDRRAARGVAMGGVARGKQNNFSISALGPHLVVWAEFRDRLLEFAGVAQTGQS
jgi:hypothetical protein